MSTKLPFTVALTIQCGTKRFYREFAVDAPTERDAVQVAEQHMAHLPDSDPIHTDGDGDWLRVVDSHVDEGHRPGAWRWEGGWNGRLVKPDVYGVLLERTQARELLWRPLRPPSEGSAWGVSFGTFEVEVEQRTAPLRDVLLVRDVERGGEFHEHVHVLGDALFQAATDSWFSPSDGVVQLCRVLRESTGIAVDRKRPA